MAIAGLVLSPVFFFLLSDEGKRMIPGNWWWVAFTCWLVVCCVFCFPFFKHQLLERLAPAPNVVMPSGFATGRDYKPLIIVISLFIIAIGGTAFLVNRYMHDNALIEIEQKRDDWKGEFEQLVKSKDAKIEELSALAASKIKQFDQGKGAQSEAVAESRKFQKELDNKNVQLVEKDKEIESLKVVQKHLEDRRQSVKKHLLEIIATAPQAEGYTKEAGDKWVAAAGDYIESVINFHGREGFRRYGGHETREDLEISISMIRSVESKLETDDLSD